MTPGAGSEGAWVALALTPGIGRARFEVLIARFGTPDAVLEASVRELREVPGISPAAATAIREREPAQGHTVIAATHERDGHVLLPFMPAFPPLLLRIPDAPIALFAVGRLDLLSAPAVAIVGSRSHSRYGAGVCRHLAGGAARAGLAVVSGMARGIDALAHAAALDAGGGTIGVLGNGLGVVYPAANRALYDRMAEHGCLLTEFPPGERPHAGSFPRRNRLISGLARATVVVEARERSGALITVGCALEQGREVLAVPGPVTSPVSVGCNRLIQHGAKPVLGLRDILEEYGIELPDVPGAALPDDLSTEERRVMTLLEGCEPHIDEIAAGLGVSAAHALALLTALEIRGIVEQTPGKRFRRTLAPV